MRNATPRIRQLLIGMLAMLSLSVSSVAACACSHHVQDPQPERSCHAPVPQKHYDDDAVETAASFEESCVCVQKAIKLSVKSEGFKLKKQASTFVGVVELSKPRLHSTVALPASDDSFRHWERPFIGSISSRGPPVR